METVRLSEVKCSSKATELEEKSRNHLQNFQGRPLLHNL